MKNVITILAILFSNITFAQSVDYCNPNSVRSWWDVQHYSLSIEVNPKNRTIKGKSSICAIVKEKAIDTLQIDLDSRLKIKSIYYKGKKLAYIKGERSHKIIGHFSQLKIDEHFDLEIIYSGKPQIAFNAPWDGGLVFKKDKNGNPWIAVACQGDGASVWWPCKDDPSDEPDNGVDLFYTTTNNLVAVGNGQLIEKKIAKKKTEWHWRVRNPINLYDITFYVGDYMHWSDSLQGEEGNLLLDYWVLRDNLAKSKKQFEVVKPMINCFENWFGPYPFYEDGYKLVDAPYLGMEHQSAIAYGNEYKMGYLGMDRSMSGVGLLFDYIIVHESGHEWFGNNISIKDVAYSWIHEGFTTYSESLFAECQFGKEKGYNYQHGEWNNISNDRPMEGMPGNCDGGSGDHYDKGAAMIHMIRTIMNDDEKFKMMLREMNSTFAKETVTGQQIETYINEFSNKDFSAFFNQFLRTNQIPILEFIPNDENIIQYKWSNCLSGFDMPILIYLQEIEIWLYPSTEWQTFETVLDLKTEISVSPDFYIDQVKH
ncbi:MAG: M1 family metallopeptidase [Crocinitomicaceae bacterium]